MAVYKKPTEWKRWHGSPADIAAIARQARALISDKDDSQQVCRCPVTVALPGLETTFDSPDEFEEQVVIGDLPRIESIRLAAEVPGEDLAVVVAFNSASPAVSLDVRGKDRKDVEGITGILRERLNQGRRVGEALFLWMPIGLGILLTIAWLAVIFAWDDAPWELAFLGGLAGVFWVIPSMILNRLVPVLELRTAGAQTKWMRSRKWLFRTMYAAAALSASTILTLVVTAIVK
jgi:hypothetical protein